MKKITALVIAGIAFSAHVAASAADAPAPIGTRNIVIVPGAFVDGSGWRVVHDILIHKGYHVSIVGQPNTTLDENVAATRSIINAQDGAVVLVGHSSGGSVITIAGNRAKVTALVYVAALQPDIGESIDQLTASMPAPGNDIHSTRDGHLYFEQNKFGADFAGDLSSNRTDFMAVSQQFVSQEIFAAPVWESAWRSKPSYAIVAADDRVLNPDLQRRMYQRAGSIVTEIKGSHAVYISQPEADQRAAPPPV